VNYLVIVYQNKSKHVVFVLVTHLVLIVSWVLLSIQPDDEGINYAAMTGTIGRSGVPIIPGAEDMMSEMARRLRERRARAESGAVVSVTSVMVSVQFDCVQINIGWHRYIAT